MPLEAWDRRDNELGLREKMAQLVSTIVSGLEDAVPEQRDFDLADHIRDEIEKWVENDWDLDELAKG